MVEKLINEFVIENQCVVYQNVLTDIDFIFNEIKNSENINKHYVIEQWESWGGSVGDTVTYGKKSSFFVDKNKYRDHLMPFEMDGSEAAIEKFYNEVNIYDNQLKCYNEVRYAILDCIKKYIEKYASSNLNMYPNYVDFSNTGLNQNKKLSKDMLNIAYPEGNTSSWDGSLGWSESRFDILKHTGNTNREYAIGWHTDRFQGLDNSPGPKQILTATLYLNDDYEGGEIAFLKHDEKIPSVVVYKPKAGDITVFPSSSPFFHAAMPLKTEVSKYFVRFFLTWGHHGDDDWYESAKKYGRKEWVEMEQKRVTEEIFSGKHRRHIILPNNIPNIDSSDLPLHYFSESQTNAEDLYIKRIANIDGRSLQD